MKIQINEVWNSEGKSVKIAVIDSVGNHRANVWAWIRANRPELDMASNINAHGFHAEAVTA